MKPPQIHLTAWRLSKALSQQELAESSGIPQPLISRIEQGHDTRLSTLSRLAEALRIPLGNLFHPPKETAIPLDRHTVDAIAQAIISGGPLPDSLAPIADALRRLVSQKLLASGALGRAKNRGGHWHAPRRMLDAHARFGTQAVRQILARVDMLLAMGAAS